MQLAAAKGSEMEELLGRLSDVNDEMGSALSGAGDSRSHTLARHREIMVELTQARSPLVQPGGLQAAYVRSALQRSCPVFGWRRRGTIALTQS